MSFHFTVKLWLFYEKDFFCLFIRMLLRSRQKYVCIYGAFSAIAFLCFNLKRGVDYTQATLLLSRTYVSLNRCILREKIWLVANAERKKGHLMCECVCCEWRCSEIMEANAYSIKASSMHWSSSKCYVIFIKNFVFFRLWRFLFVNSHANNALLLLSSSDEDK